MRRPIPKVLRFEVLKRDGFTCQYCGAKAPEVRLHVDHRTPVAAQGKTVVGNLVTACVDCNLGKGARFLGVTAEDRSAIKVLAKTLPARWTERAARRELEAWIDVSAVPIGVLQAAASSASDWEDLSRKFWDAVTAYWASRDDIRADAHE